jgi:hypothetical protein
MFVLTKIEIGSPTAASSPVYKQKPPRNYPANKRNDALLRVLVINCQSDAAVGLPIEFSLKDKSFKVS